MKTLIDADIILYSCGFSAESTIYRVVSSGRVIASFRYKKEVDEFVTSVGLSSDDYELVKDKEIEPVANALSNAKQLIKRIILRTNADKYQLYLTGDGNFREEIATIKKYKGNRDSNHKPYHFDSIKRYLIENWGAIVVEGIEADDQMSIDQMESSEGTTCIASIDKDLNCTPGFHFNWNQDCLYWVTEHDAVTWFYCQMIMGDTVDNIQGVPKAGKKKAYKLFSECDTIEDMYWATLNLYCKAYEKPMEALLENGRLLNMQRYEGELWCPPH